MAEKGPLFTYFTLNTVYLSVVAGLTTLPPHSPRPVPSCADARCLCVAMAQKYLFNLNVLHWHKPKNVLVRNLCDRLVQADG